MPATDITTIDVTAIEAAWQNVAAYLATLGIHKPADADDDYPNSDFWRQVDALQQRDPVFSRLMEALAVAAIRSTSSSRELLAGGARTKLKVV